MKKLYEELDIIAHPECLYNVDEKGCCITAHKQNVVLAEKGNIRVHLVAPEHAENVTIAMCVNAVGNAIPPMIIFKGNRYRSKLGSNLPPGTKVSMAPKGTMTSSLSSFNILLNIKHLVSVCLSLMVQCVIYHMRLWKKKIKII